MRRPMLVMVCVLLVTALMLPAIAIAGRPATRGRDSAPGQMKKAATPQAEIAVEDEAAGEATPEQSGKNGKPAWASSKKSAKVAGAEADEDGALDDAEETDGDAEDEDAAEPALTGIANALARIQANIAKAEEKVAAGTKKQVPPGLLNVVEKFMRWLGLIDQDESGDSTAPDEADDGSTEDSGTADPDPSVEDSPTPDSDQPTDTVAPPVPE